MARILHRREQQSPALRTLRLGKHRESGNLPSILPPPSPPLLRLGRDPSPLPRRLLGFGFRGGALEHADEESDIVDVQALLAPLSPSLRVGGGRGEVTRDEKRMRVEGDGEGMGGMGLGGMGWGGEGCRVEEWG